MRIDEIIKICKENSKGYGEIDDEKSRDQILFGDTDKECTGIVTTIYASADVIAKAAEMNANLIIAHESLFWNHGDHTDWLENNRSFQMKKRLFKISCGCVPSLKSGVSTCVRYPLKNVYLL